MNYPEDFTVDQQAAVEAEKILANEAFVKARRFIGNDYQSIEKLAELIRQYVTRLMLVFARQACDLGRIRTWTVSHIDVTVKWFIYQIASEAQSEKTYFHDGTDARHISLIYAREVTQKEMHHIRASGEWEEYQKQLLEVANIQKTSIAFQPPEFEDDDATVIDAALLKETVDLLESIAETKGAINAPTSSRDEEISRRHQLLEEYKAATD